MTAPSLTISDAAWAHPTLPPPADLILGVEATLRLVSGTGELTYEEPFFAVVEAALAVQDWLATALPAGEDFAFDSMDWEEPGVLWCRRNGSTWCLGARHQARPDPCRYTTAEVEHCLGDFVRQVEAATTALTGLTPADARSAERPG